LILNIEKSEKLITILKPILSNIQNTEVQAFIREIFM